LGGGGFGGWGVGGGVGGLAPTPQPPIPNPQSPIPNPQFLIKEVMNNYLKIILNK